MTVEFVRTVLGWCVIFNTAIILVWWGAMAALKGRILQLHQRLFALSREQFDVIHYSLMGVFKLGVLLFNAVPWIVLHIVA